MKRVLIINTAGPDTSSGHLFTALGQALESSNHSEVEIAHLKNGAGIWAKLSKMLLPSLRCWRAIRRADIVIVHTTVFLAAWEILMARAFGKRLLAVFWDSYPESFMGLGRTHPGLSLKCYGWGERGLLRLCDVILPPSEDYLPHLLTIGLADKAEFLPIWPFTDIRTPVMPSPRREDTVEICFAGAVNVIRGLDHALHTLVKTTDNRIELHFYGRNAPSLPESLPRDRVTLVDHGFVAQGEIMERLATHDFGLVSLHPDFALPAFPSKCISYICAGLPVLYTGPPLRSFEKFLTETETGLALEAGMEVDLGSHAHALRADFAKAQQKALRRVNLSEDKIAKILQ